METSSSKSENETIIVYEKKDNIHSCCVCFDVIPTLVTNLNREKDLSLNDINIDFFENKTIPNDILLLSCCNKHYICINCLKRFVNNYENHPINENNSHIYCPYPFEECLNKVGFKNIFIHSDIHKILKTEEELNNYIIHSNQYEFPGYTIIKCPMTIIDNKLCGANILIENEYLKIKGKGEIILQCDQNNACLRRFCLTCKKTISYQSVCYECIISYENENPRMYNYFLNKKQKIINEIKHAEFSLENPYFENEYLYINGEITKEIAVKQILELIENVDSYMICPICKVSLYKTEKCNGLSHHNIERCYACGRIGYKIKGLGDHWSPNGISGCYRFDTDEFIKNNIKNYLCLDSICTNHELGDCSNPEHKDGINEIFKSRKKAYVYHTLISLLVDIRYDVYDELYNILKNKDENLLEFLPYKQTLKIIEIKKDRLKDYTEDIVYETLNLENPKELKRYKEDKKFYINFNEYEFLYKKNKIEDIIDNNISYNLDDEHEDNNDINIQIQNIQNTLYEIDERLTTINENLMNTEDEDVDMTDLMLLPPPPNYLRRQNYDDYEEEGSEYSDDSYTETRELIPMSSLVASCLINTQNEISGNTVITPQIRNDGYMLLDDILDFINDDYENE